jgi:hypothetical protein
LYGLQCKGVTVPLLWLSSQTRNQGLDVRNQQRKKGNREWNIDCLILLTFLARALRFESSFAVRDRIGDFEMARHQSQFTKKWQNHLSLDAPARPGIECHRVMKNSEMYIYVRAFSPRYLPIAALVK